MKQEDYLQNFCDLEECEYVFESYCDVLTA